MVHVSLPYVITEKMYAFKVLIGVYISIFGLDRPLIKKKKKKEKEASSSVCHGHPGTETTKVLASFWPNTSTSPPYSSHK